MNIKYLICIIFCLIFLMITGCQKKKSSDKTDQPVIADHQLIENITQYIKYKSVYAYKNEQDLIKEPQKVKEKILLSFANKVTILKSQTFNKKEYYRIKLPDNSEYWINHDALTEKFIVINQQNTTCYYQPQNDFITPIKLQPGDFGVFIKESDGWLNVDFYAYRLRKTSGNRQWVGPVWIKDGYTEDLKAAKEAFNLYYAYYYMIAKKNINEAIKYCKAALEVNFGEETEITYIIRDYLAELEAEKEKITD